MMKPFRTLRADEIDCRVAQVKENGVSLLLYKDARCDMNILDETVGSENWQRRHSRDNSNCTVSLWDDTKKQWIEKEDTGTESNTEKEKGLASDSFKRACFNWGIGRELYTAPFVWISAETCKIEPYGNDQRTGKDKYTCRDRFYVSQIGYDDRRCINMLVIKCKNKVVYKMGEVAGTGSGDYATPPDDQQETPQGTPELVTDAMRKTFISECKRIGKRESSILKAMGIPSLAEMTVQQFKTAMVRFKATPTKAETAPNTVPPESEDSGLPWNTTGR